MANIPKTIFGIQTAIIGGALDFSAKTPKILSRKTKAKASNIPMAKLAPIPPLRFIEDTATAIIVSINAATGTLYFLYKTTKYVLMFLDPRALSFLIKLFNSVYESVSAIYTTGVKSSKSKL